MREWLNRWQCGTEHDHLTLHSLASPSEQTAFKGDSTNEDGLMAQYELCGLKSHEDTVLEFDEESKVPYMNNGDK